MRFHEKRNFQLLIAYSLASIVFSNVVFTVEENSVANQTRHLHKIRHSRGSTPYLTASSSVINPREANRLESFSLNCPHVVDSSNKNVNIEVVWTLNETVWLKIENGLQRVVNGESTFHKRRVSGKTVMRLLLNNARYLFDYDELTGDFSMEISPVLWSSDCGAWQCHVTVRQQDGKSHTLTSRRRIRPGEIGARKETRDEETKRTEILKKRKEDLPKPRIEETPTATQKAEEQIEHIEFASLELDPSTPIHLQKRGDRSSDLYQNVASFSRNSDDNVYMTRKEEELTSNVIFARNDGPVRHKHHHRQKPIRHRELERLFDAQIDYELDMATDDMAYAYPNYLNMNSRSRTRSAQYYLNGGAESQSYLIMVSLILSAFFV